MPWVWEAYSSPRFQIEFLESQLRHGSGKPLFFIIEGEVDGFLHNRQCELAVAILIDGPLCSHFQKKEKSRRGLTPRTFPLTRCSSPNQISHCVSMSAVAPF